MYLSGSATVCHARSGARSSALTREERRKRKGRGWRDNCRGEGKGMEKNKGKGKEEHPVKRLLTKPKRQRMHNLFLLSYPALSQCVSYVRLLRVILQVL